MAFQRLLPRDERICGDIFSKNNTMKNYLEAILADYEVCWASSGAFDETTG